MRKIGVAFIVLMTTFTAFGFSEDIPINEQEFKQFYFQTSFDWSSDTRSGIGSQLYTGGSFFTVSANFRPFRYTFGSAKFSYLLAKDQVISASLTQEIPQTYNKSLSPSFSLEYSYNIIQRNSGTIAGSFTFFQSQFNGNSSFSIFPFWVIYNIDSASFTSAFEYIHIGVLF